MSKFILTIFASLLFLIFAATAQAQTQTPVSSRYQQFDQISLGGVLVSGSQTASVSLGRSRYIRNLVIQAEGVGRDSIVEVMVNGVVKGTLYAPGSDPSYVVTVAEVSDSIQFRHHSGGSMRVIAIQATVGPWPGSHFGGGFYGSPSELRNLAQRTLMVIEALKPFVDAADEKTYLLPIKQQAGYAIVYLNAHGNVSKKSIQALQALIYEIDFAHGYIEDLMQADETFEMAVELLTVRETLDDLLD